jgi:hypothetical protein
MSEETSELEKLIAKKVAAGLTPAHAREVVERQLKRDAAEEKKAKAKTKEAKAAS